MTTSSRWLAVLAAVLLLGVYATPLWQIQLRAPQYPEGLGLLIHHNTITGSKPNDLRNLNGLNHYIGMKEIEPEMVTTLKVIPYALGFFVVFGLIVAATGSRALLKVWLALLVLALLAAFGDYYRWLYDYGHNLDPNAAIKVPGMTYQPPLIGWKQLLNMTAYSWPHWGSLLIALSLISASAGLWMSKQGKGHEMQPV